MFDMGGGPYRIGELLRPRVGRSMRLAVVDGVTSRGALMRWMPNAAAAAVATATMDPKNGRFIGGFMFVVGKGL